MVVMLFFCLALFGFSSSADNLYGTEVKELLDSIDKNWHITGSYTTAARYTKYIDFSDAEPVDFKLTGTFRWCDSEENLVLKSRR